MIGRGKGEDINEAFKGPVGYFGIGIILIGVAMAYAATVGSDEPAPDRTVLFGGFLKDLIVELKYYLYSVVPMVIVGGALMIALQLRIHPHKIQFRISSPKR